MIAGYFNGGRYQRRHPFVRVSILLPSITTDFVPVDFMIDTGATATCLHPLDTLGKLGIDPAALSDPTRWPRQQASWGIGGSANNYVHDATYLFHHDDGTVAFTISTETIDIAQPTRANQSFHSLLGMDLLRFFKLTMDPASGIVFLEL